MKKMHLLFLVLIININLFSQERLSFEKIITVDSVKQNQIHNTLKEWIGMNYVSAKNVTEIDDKDAGLIIISPMKNYNFGKITYVCYDGTIKYSIKIQIRDGRYKVVVTNFFHQVNIGNGAACSLGLITNDLECPVKNLAKRTNDNVWLDIKIKAEIIFKDLVSNLESINYKTSFNDSDNNW